MSYIVDFNKVSTVGLESSPVAEALAGLRANEARYFMNKYKHEFTVVPAGESQETLDLCEPSIERRTRHCVCGQTFGNVSFSSGKYQNGLRLL